MVGLKADLRAVPATPRFRSGPAVVESADLPSLLAAVSAHGGALFGLAYQSLGDRALAEEAVRETFVRAWRARARYDASVGPVRNWLFAIGRRVVIDLAGARARRNTGLTGSTSGDALEPDARLGVAFKSWHAHEAIGRLSPGHRQVLVEMYYRGRPGSELAAELGVTEDTIRTRLFHALRTFRRQLEEIEGKG